MRRLMLIPMVVLALLVSTSVAAAQEEPTFPDVPVGSAHFETIESLADDGIFLGRHDGTFGPSEQITALHVSLVLSRLTPRSEIVRSIPSDGQAERDIPQREEPWAGYDSESERDLLDIGLVDPPQLIVFDNRTVNRGELAESVVAHIERSTRSEMEPHPTGKVGDTQVSDEIGKLLHAGILVGREGGQVASDAQATRAQLASVAHRVREWLADTPTD